MVYGESGGWEGPPRIDWETVEACNTGVPLPDETDEEYTCRILFSWVSRGRGGGRGREGEEAWGRVGGGLRDGVREGGKKGGRERNRR